MFGVHPSYNKFTARKKIVEMPAPSEVVMPVSQHIGAPNVECVAVGESVKRGQVIAKNDAFVSAHVHSSISGTVKRIEDRDTPLGIKIKSIIIETDNEDKGFIWTVEKKIEKLKEMGIVGLGGATFPTHVKLLPKDKKIEKIIVNGAECEPYLTCDHRLMLEHTQEIINGLKTLMDITGTREAIIGIEENKRDAINHMKREAKGIKVSGLPLMYPQGAEKVLIHSLIDKWVPAGGLPIDIGVVVVNVGTLKAIDDAFNGTPLISRVVTVTGDVKERQNVRVRIGTTFRDLIDFCGGFKGTPKKVIAGGPMMGIAQFGDDVPVMKGTSGVLVLNKIAKEEEQPCSRCSKCVEVCPMNLMPVLLQKNSRKGRWEECKDLGAMDCFECGCCSYVCPCKIPIVQLIKDAKVKIRVMGK